MKHNPKDPWCTCPKCNPYICSYCAADLNGFDGTTEDGDILCQDCFYTRDSGEYSDWDCIPDPETY